MGGVIGLGFLTFLVVAAVAAGRSSTSSSPTRMGMAAFADPVRGPAADLTPLHGLPDDKRTYMRAILKTFPDLTAHDLRTIERLGYEHSAATPLLQQIIRYVDPTYVFHGR